MAVSVQGDPMSFVSPGQMQQMDANETDVFIILDRECCHHYVNKPWFMWENLKSRYNYHGKELTEIPSAPYQLVGEQVRRKFNLFFHRRQTQSFLEVHQWLHKDAWRAIISSADFIRNTEGDVEGVLWRALLLPNSVVNLHMDIRDKLGVYEKESTMLLENPEGLADTEFDDVFMLMMGYNTKQAGFQRGVTQNAVCMTLSSARLKLHLDNNEQLLEYAMDNHWYNYLPAMMRNSNRCYPLSSNSSYLAKGQ